MAKDSLPTYKQKQQLLYAKQRDPALLSSWGRKLVEHGWLCDAIDFYAAAGDQVGLEQLRRLAREQGDIFLLRRCLTELKVAADEKEWGVLGKQALALGKLQYAREAFRMAGDRKSLDEVDALIQPSVPAAPPPEEGEEDGTEPE